MNHTKQKSKWPDGKIAAVSLTYEDGLEFQLINAISQLDKYGFKGTFFPFTNGLSNPAFRNTWV